MPFTSVDQNGSRAGFFYTKESDAVLDANARNAKAENLGIKARYKAVPLEVPDTDKSPARTAFRPLK